MQCVNTKLCHLTGYFNVCFCLGKHSPQRWMDLIIIYYYKLALIILIVHQSHNKL